MWLSCQACSQKMLELHQKRTFVSKKMLDKYKDSFPSLCELSCKCTGNHRASCGCLTEALISKAHTNFTSILIEAQSQEQFVRRLKALPQHARDVHQWDPGRCDFHPLRVCTCGKCDQDDVVCEGKRYYTRMKLDFELLYGIEFAERASQANKLVHPVLKRGHSNAVESSHHVLRSKDIAFEKLHYHLSTSHQSWLASSQPDHHCMDIASEVFGEGEVHCEC